MGKRTSRVKGKKASRSSSTEQGSIAAQMKAKSAQKEGLDPLLYVALHTGNTGDVAFYLSQCLGQEVLHLQADECAPLPITNPAQVSVLELGCGAGRISLPLLEAGARVVGVDTHAGLLSLLDKTATDRGIDQHLKLLCADMRTLNLKERFDYVLITYNTLYCALTWDEQVDCLSRAAAHLKPNGRLLIDGYALPDPEDFLYETDEDFEPLTVVELPELKANGALPSTLWCLSDLQYFPLLEEEHEGSEAQSEEHSAQTIEHIDLTDSILDQAEDEISPELEARLVGVEERDVHDQATQSCVVHYRFRKANGTMRDEIIEHRYLFPKQLPEMLESAGLSLHCWWHDFELGMPDETCEQWALCATLRTSKLKA